MASGTTYPPTASAVSIHAPESCPTTEQSDEELLGLILAASNDGIVDHDLINGVTRYSARFKIMLGYEADDALSESEGLWKELTHPDDLERISAAWNDHVEDNWPFDETWRMRHWHGGYRWVRGRGVVVPGVPRATRALTLFADVTERVEQAARHRALVGAMPDSLLTISREGIIRDIHPEHGKHALFPESARHHGKALQEVCAEEVAAQLIEVAAQSLATGELHTIDLAPTEAQTLSIEVRAIPIGSEETLLIIRDTTERRQLMAQLVQAQKLDSIGRLSAGLAHEINTPLQYIGDNVRFLEKANQKLFGLIGKYRSLLVDSAPDAEAKAAKLEKRAKLPWLEENISGGIASCIEGVDRVSGIVQAMKYFSHQGGDTKEPVDLNEALTATARVSRGEWKTIAKLDLDLDDIPTVECAAGPIKQCFLNIVVNATHALADKYGESGQGHIKISSHAVEELAEVRISDNGTGIPEHVVASIFDPFFTTKDVGKGTGQGLSMAWETIVEQHGGQLLCETHPGEGTTFIIRLPFKGASAGTTP